MCSRASAIATLIQSNFPEINVKEFSDCQDNGGNIKPVWDGYDKDNDKAIVPLDSRQIWF